ncbi:hypothetical protein WR25_27134 [Diploscapter pachys]|uniref:Uncharacterized protein n=1 Tax=Diploscapter pachys TaxID=2018661 RepID=A0A2A2KUJ6_9BILA|nr:hypothetical protein WR25_27134 [Diploscapter pachys]
MIKIVGFALLFTVISGYDVPGWLSDVKEQLGKIETKDLPKKIMDCSEHLDKMFKSDISADHGICMEEFIAKEKNDDKLVDCMFHEIDNHVKVDLMKDYLKEHTAKCITS